MERTPVFNHSQVILSGTLSPGVCAFPWSLICNSIPVTTVMRASIISWNHIWSVQQDVNLISSPPYFTNLPRTSCISFGGGKAYIRPTGHSTFSTSPPEALISEMSVLRYWGALNVLFLTNRYTIVFPIFWKVFVRQEFLNPIPRVLSLCTGCLFSDLLLHGCTPDRLSLHLCGNWAWFSLQDHSVLYNGCYPPSIDVTSGNSCFQWYHCW